MYYMRYLIQTCLTFICLYVFFPVFAWSACSKAPLTSEPNSEQQVLIKYHKIVMGSSLSNIALLHFGQHLHFKDFQALHNANIKVLKAQLLSDGIDPKKAHPEITNPNTIEKNKYLYIAEELSDVSVDDGSHKPVFTGNISISGSSTLYPLIGRLIECFKKDNDLIADSELEVSEINGSRKGLEYIINYPSNASNGVLTGVSDLSLFDSQSERVKKSLVHFSLARDSVTFIVQPNLFVSQPSISKQGLSYLLRKNKRKTVDQWDEIPGLSNFNPALDRSKIDIYRLYPSADSGTLSFVVNKANKELGVTAGKSLKVSHMLDSVKDFKAESEGGAAKTLSHCVNESSLVNYYNATEDDRCLLDSIAQVDRSLIAVTQSSWRKPNFGFVSTSYVNVEQYDKRSILLIDGDSSLDTDYAFSRDLYIFTRKDIVKDHPELCDVLEYFVRHSNTVANQMGYKMVRNTEADKNKIKLKEVCGISL